MAELSGWRSESSDPGVTANERLTALTGALLVVLLALMGVTVLSVRPLLPEHFLLGFLLIPPVALKVFAAASLTYATPFIFFREG